MNGIEELLREALTRAQDEAPIAEEMFAGVVRRRRRHRRTVALVVVAAVATIAAIVVPVSLGVSAGPKPTGPTHHLHRTPTPIGDITGKWILDEMGSSVVVGDHAFVTAVSGNSVELIRVGDDGVRRLPLSSSLVTDGNFLMLAGTPQALYVVSPGDDSGNSPVLKIDPVSFAVTAQVELPGQAKNVAATESSLYVRLGNRVLKLDPQTLVVVRTYLAHRRGDGDSTTDMLLDGDRVDVIGLHRPSLQTWILHLSSDLQPMGAKTPIGDVNDLVWVETSCGLAAIHKPQGPTSTVDLAWPDHRIKPLVTNEGVGGLAETCPAHWPAYMLTTSGNTQRVERVDVKPHGRPAVVAKWTPDPMLPFTSMSLSDRDLWLFGPTIVRVRLPASG